MFFCSHFSLTFSFFLGIVTNSSIIELNKKTAVPREMFGQIVQLLNKWR